ncbi:MAG: hypothetical protein RJA36_2423 [Pseudomonadota bacterium]
MRTPIEYAASLSTAHLAPNEKPRRVVRVYPGEDFCVPLKEGERVSIVIVDPLAELQRFFGILAVVFGVIAVAGWAVVQIARVGLVS